MILRSIEHAQAVGPRIIMDAEPQDRHDSDVAAHRVLDRCFRRSRHLTIDAERRRCLPRRRPSHPRKGRAADRRA